MSNNTIKVQVSHQMDTVEEFHIPLSELVNIESLLNEKQYVWKQISVVTVNENGVEQDKFIAVRLE